MKERIRFRQSADAEIGAAMATALDSGALDMIGLARPIAAQPDMPARLQVDRDHAPGFRAPPRASNGSTA